VSKRGAAAAATTTSRSQLDKTTLIERDYKSDENAVYWSAYNETG